jgi:DedD protein
MAEEKQDVETLKRRGRRRLVGAVALVLAAVIVLPMVFDPEPRGTPSSVNVRIPGEDETPFAPKPPPKKAKEEYVVQVGAFASPQGVIAKLDSAKVPYYTEVIQGNLTRVRAGPFATREAAEKALEQLKSLGFEPGAVASKSG